MSFIEKCKSELIESYGSLKEPVLYISLFVIFGIVGAYVMIFALNISVTAEAPKYTALSVIGFVLGVFVFAYGLTRIDQLDYYANRERFKRIESKLDKLLEKRE